MSDDKKIMFLAVPIAALLLSASFYAFLWYPASVQAKVWQREGVKITTWEVLWGAQPVTRDVRISAPEKGESK
jgi:hypothetical protein